MVARLRLREIATAPMDLKPARWLFWLWVAVSLFAIANSAVAVIAGAWLSAAFSGGCAIFYLVMLRWAVIRLVDAKRRQEKADWERAMFEEWAR